MGCKEHSTHRFLGLMVFSCLLDGSFPGFTGPSSACASHSPLELLSFAFRAPSWSKLLMIPKSVSRLGIWAWGLCPTAYWASLPGCSNNMSSHVWNHCWIQLYANKLPSLNERWLFFFFFFTDCKRLIPQKAISIAEFKRLLKIFLLPSQVQIVC